MKKYDLAPDESTQFGKIAHFVVMPHVDKQLIEGFVSDLRGWKKSTEGRQNLKVEDFPKTESPQR